MFNSILRWTWHFIFKDDQNTSTDNAGPHGYRALLWPPVILVLTGSCVYADCAPGHSELGDATHYAELYNWPEAAPHLANAEALFRKCGDQRDKLFAHVLQLRANMEQRNLSEFSAELATLLSTPRAHHDLELRMWMFIVKGDADNHLQFPEIARKDWQNVQALARATQNSKWVYRADGELSIPAYYQGDIATARRLVTSALTTASAANDYGSVVRLLTHIGTVYVMLQQYKDGLDHLDKALEVVKAYPEIGYPINVKEGQVLGLLGENRLNEAEQLAKEIIGNTEQYSRHVNEAQTLVMLASVYERKKQISNAIQELQKAIKLAAAGSFQQSLADAEFALADIYRQQGKLADAELHAERAVRSTRDSGMLSALPVQMQVLAALKATEGKYREADLLYRKAADEVDALLLSTPLSSKVALLKSTSDIYTQHFSLVADHLPDVDAAYSIVERVRGRSIADLLRSGLLQNTPDAEAIEHEISGLRLQLAKATSAAEIARIRNQIFLAQHKRWLASADLTPFRRNVDRILPLGRVEQHLDTSDVLVEYVAGQSRFYAIVITRERARLVRLQRTSEITTLASSFLEAVRSKKTALREGSALYAALFGSLSEIDTHLHLIVVPDGPLHSVPFAALVDQRGIRLVETHTIVRAPSASTHALLQEPTTATGEGLLAVGGVLYNPDTTRIAKLRGYEDEPLGNLPGSRDEALAAAGALRPVMKSDLLLDQNATESAFKGAQLPAREVIHLGVHGTASPDDAEKAALVFLSDPKANEDGVLEVPEIVRLRLHSDLVVLSACDTAVGMLQGEEGVSNLARAFLLAGARTVVSTLWSIDDSFSATLMKTFYSALANGHSKSDSLVSAQRTLLRRFSETAVPYYWAGYVIEGSADTALPNFEAKGITRGNSADHELYKVP
jgi:CHAT domain-containing protein